jgi:AcrR family transcriptional regulator
MVRRTAEQAAATRRDLLDAAVVVFGERGFAAATLDQIADRAGVTRGALYHHFEDKADVYDAVLREKADRTMRPLTAELAGDGPPLQRLDRFLRSYCSALERDATFRAVLELLLFAGNDAPGRSRELTARGYRAWLHTFHAVLMEASQRGELRAGVTPGTASRALMALTVGLTTTTLQSPGLFSPSRAAASVHDVLLRGIAGSPTRPGFEVPRSE